MKERIRELRKALGLTLEEFGARIGLGKSALSRIESGVNGVTDQTILSICREFSASEEWLRTGSGEMLVQTNENVAGDLAEKYNLGLYGEQLLATYLELSDADKRAVERFVARLTAKVQEAENALGAAPSTEGKDKLNVAE